MKTISRFKKWLNQPEYVNVGKRKVPLQEYNSYSGADIDTNEAKLIGYILLYLIIIGTVTFVICAIIFGWKP